MTAILIKSRTATLAAALSIAAGLGVAVLAQGQGGQPQQGQQQGRGGGGGGRGQQPTRDVTAQPTTIGTGSITGTVTTAGAGTPVRRARIALSGAEIRGGRSTVTNDEGVFTFAALPLGRYTLTASKAGYVNISYGAKRSGRPGTPIQLADGQKLEKADISLPRGSVVTGIVVDENGEPSPGTQVRVLRYVMRTGEKTLQQTGQDSTDDRGIYRIYGLQPGDYLVSAVPRNLNVGDIRQTVMAEVESLLQQAQAAGSGNLQGLVGGGGRGGRGGAAAASGIDITQLMGGGRGQALLDQAQQLQEQLAQQAGDSVAYAPVYYPGTSMPSSASPVTLGIGEERNGVDFQLQLVQTARVRGLVQGPDGTLPQGTQISLIPMDQAGAPPVPGIGMNMARASQNGEFSFTGIPPGQYRVMARAAVRDPNAPQAGPGQPGFGGGRGGGGRGGPGQIAQVLWASADVNVAGQDVGDLVLSLQPGMTITGRVSFEGSALLPPTDLTRVRVNLSPRGQQQGMNLGGVPPALVDATGRFTITGVAPGAYSLSANAPANNPSAGGAGGAAGRTGGAGVPTGQWVLKSAVATGRDVLDFGLTVEPNQDVGGVTLTFVDRTQNVSGTIQDTMGNPTADYTIIIFPADRTFWLPQARRIQSSRPGTDGKFAFGTLPPGDYRLTAVTDVEPGEWYDPDFLSQLVNASIPLTLREGEKKVQDIKLAGGGN